MGTGVPQEAIGVSVTVLVYSFICFTLVTLFICMLWAYGERWTYVAFLAKFSALSTAGSIAQQIHYNREWLIIKHDDYMRAVEALDTPDLGRFAAVSNTLDLIFFTIRELAFKSCWPWRLFNSHSEFYSYNVMALMVLFWAVKLFCGSWEIRANFLGGWMLDRISLISKIFAITIPAILVGFGHSSFVLKSRVSTFIVTNLTMLVCLSIGTILMILILYKYIKTRRLLYAHEKRNEWWGPSATDTTVTGHGDVNDSMNGTGNGTHTSKRRSLYDRALITRFTIGFIILLVFEAVLVIFSLYSEDNAQKVGESLSPDFSIAGCITEIILFTPGVTTSMLIFLVFGTAKSFRQYKELITSCCGRRTQFPKSKRRRVMLTGGEERGTEFQRLPSMGIKVPTPEEQAVLEAKLRDMLPDQRTSIGTQYTTSTIQTENTRQESSEDTSQSRTLNPSMTNLNFSLPTISRNDIRPVVREEERDVGVREAWAEQNDLEAGPELEQKWMDDEYGYGREGDSAGSMAASNTEAHGDLDSISRRDLILDDGDGHA
ncbi:hypothetical protein DSL72_006365 [Monilinia vaccinii-corymbosi]|uniref:Uncharacterized protein n=1 Tax=Monilinia vaccinii-corymbosi TaxID=61207 RepID=A0A8A3PNH4_9HELO|nr:hypothetical protein DSL72_006365 [Monilinia vaccinii-corymbosi]